ncbi:MAG: hypothetical protein ACTSRB_18300, partial [Candidatus Helarchaeota archaeon]
QELIQKKTLIKVGSVQVGGVDLNPLFLHEIRKLLGIPEKDYTLITGCTWNPNHPDDRTLDLPEIGKKLLEESKFHVTKTTCFITPPARERRVDKKYPPLDYHEFGYASFQSFDLREQILRVLKEDLKEQDVILDMTPLTKVFSIILLDIAHQYNLPIFYTVRTKDGYRLEWYRKP